MGNTVVRHELVLEDRITGALTGVAAAAVKTKKALDDTATSGKALARSDIELTQAEKEMAAKIIGTNAALEAKAKALGLSTSETRLVEAATKRMSTTQALATGEVSKNGAAMASLRQTLRYLPQQFGDVVQSVAAGQPVWRALSTQVVDVGFQFGNVAAQMDMTAGVGARVLAMAGPLAVAIASVVTAVAVAANKFDAATESLDRYEKTLTNVDQASRSAAMSQNVLRLATGDVAGFVGDLQLQTALLNGEISNADMAAGQLGGKLADTLRPRLLEAGKAVAEVEVQITALRDAINSGSLDVSERVAAEGQLAALRESRQALTDNLDAIKALKTDGVDAIGAYTDAMERAAQAGEKAGKAGADVADAAERLARAQGFTQASRFGMGQTQAMSGMQASDLGFTSSQVTDLFKGAFRAAMADPIAKENAAGLWKEAIERGMTMTQALEGAAAGVGALTDPLSALGASGPQGAAAAAILSTLEDIGREGSDAIVARLEAQTEAIVNGIVELPSLLGKLMDDLPYKIGQAVAEALRSLNPFENKGNGIGGFAERMLNRFSMGLYGVGKGALGLPGVGEGFAVGDSRYISRSGLALVHEGERVVRSNGRGSPSTERMSRQGMAPSWGPPVVIQAAAVSPDVLSGLSDVITAGLDPNGWGRGTRQVFGGA